MIEHLPLLLSLFVVDLMAAMSPGPNFVLVTRSAMHRTAGHAGAVVAGLVTANLVWCAAVIFGLTAVFAAAPWLFGALKVSGGVYLIYLGVRLWTARSDAPTARAAEGHGSVTSAYVVGVLTNLSNPKSVVYFGSVFALFLGATTPGVVQLAAVAIVLFNTALWYGTVAAFFSRCDIRRAYQRLRRPIDRAAGAVMTAFGARLVLVHE